MASAGPRSRRLDRGRMSEEVGQLSTEVEHEFEHELEQGPGLAVVPGRAAHASTAVLQAKLRPGANPGHVVPRPRLHARLEESVDVPLTLVVAPAGSGKTSLLRCWAAETEVPVAWLTLDEEDRDPVRLWRGVFAALDALAPGAAAVAADLVDGPGGVPEAVGALLDELENRDREPAVLVIDDAHVVDDAWGSSLAGFVQHLPFWLHLIVAGRRTPELRVDRLRARGVLAEVQFPELRFTVDEATEMLARLVPDLDPETATRVIERAGGWAASIQLAALAARSAETQGRGYLPDHDDLARMEDYVWREVLAEERDDVVDVLVAITVVDDVETELATVLSGRADAAARLALAEQRGLFVARSETSGFVLHPLMRDVLRSGLGRTDPERVVRLHALAAGWFEVHGRTEQALDHWIAAERPRDALRLLAAQAFPLYDAGHEDTIVRIVGELPESVVPGDLDAMIEYAWAHLLVDRARFLDLVESLSRTTRDDLDVDPVRGARVQVLESIAATLRGHWADGGSLARSALQELGEAWWLDPIGRCAWNMVARDLALSERWDDAGHARRGIVRALGAVPDRRIALEGTRALAEALAGHPVDALRLATGARHATEASSASITRAEFRTAEAVAHRELGDLASAVPILEELAELRTPATPYCRLLALLELTQVRLDDGDTAAAGRAFDAAAELVENQMPGPGAMGWLARTGTLLALATGDVDGARGWAGQVRDPFWSAVSTARVLLATGDARLATEALEGAEPRCLRHQVVADLLLYRASGLAAEAEGHLLDAVRLAADHGLVQTVASEGRAVVEAVEKVAWQAPLAWLDRVRRAGQPEDPHLPDDRVELPIEALTERELAVLRMLPSRLTLREIADELYISINTLKFHLKVIYRKLGCSSRAEAAERARALAGLHRPAQPWSTRRR